MSFADLEQRTNAAVMRRLSNARALKVGATEDFPVIFSHGTVETSVGATAVAPMADALDSDITGVIAQSTQVTIDGTTTYLVIDLQPDGSGMTRLLLQEA